MNVVLRLVFVATISPAFAAHAEGGCPPGMIPYRAGADASSCGPIPSSPAPQAPAGPRWENRYGAIATDADNGIMGAVDNHASKRSASKGSVAECKARGGTECKVSVEYYNQCVVVVQGDKTANNYRAESIELATELAMEACRSGGDTDCHVYYQACSLPVRVR